MPGAGADPVALSHAHATRPDTTRPDTTRPDSAEPGAGVTADARSRAGARGPAALRALAGSAVLLALGLHLGAAPFAAGVRAVDPASAAAALAIGLVTTLCSAWRWSLVARRFGIILPLREALVECYRALFLNSVLPAGVLGDVDRAVRHGRRTGAPARCARAVVLERAAGLAVLIVVTATSAVWAQVTAGRVAPLWLAVLAPAVTIGTVLALRAARVGAGVATLSAVALAGYLATFLIAARAAGTTASVGELVPVLLPALLAMSVPVNLAGWGPREAATAAGFGVVGLGAAAGLTTAVVYGVLSFVACLPGLGVVLSRR